MNTRTLDIRHYIGIIAWVLLSITALPAFAQSEVLLSKQADFSTEDLSFDENDILYVKVVASHIDYTDLDKNEFRLKPDEGGNDIERALTNHLDGTYTTSVDLNTVDHREDDWEVRIELKDENGQEFKRRVDITVGDDDGDDDFDDDELEFTGRIDSIQNDGLSVDGIFFFVNASTVVLNDDNQPISLDDLFVGQIVEIRGDRMQDGTLLATDIKVEDNFPGEDGDDEVEFTGIIDSLSDQDIVVAGVTFLISDQTIILNDNNQPITLADLFVGQIVEIRGDRQGDGSLLATHIKVEDNVVGNDEVEFTGFIESLSATSITVNGVVFEVNDSTSVFDNNNNAIDFSELFVGQLVEIKGVRHPNGTLLAVRINIEDRNDDEVELTGEIEEINGSSLVVAGLTFVVDANTVVLDNDNQAIPFTDLSVGLIVEIRADVQPDGSLLATDIKIEDRLEDEVEVRGLVDSVGENTLVVLGREFAIVPATAIFDNNNQPVDFSAIQAGSIVEIKASLLPGGLLIAVEIELEDNEPFRVRVQGPVDSVGMDSMRVAGIFLLVSDDTSVTDQDGNPASINDLAPGQTVDVDAEIQSSGIPMATAIRIKRVVRVTGSISNLGDDGFTLAGAAVKVDTGTLILDTNNRPVASSTLTDGQVAKVRAEISATGLRASTVEILETSVSSVSIEDLDEQPRQFVLEQNYPNPFNPTTTIAFEVLGTQAAGVSLTIYNVLGQSVRTLVSSELTAGRYEVEWNGLGDDGASLASGVYLYRLQVNDQVQTRSMVLMK